LHSASDCSDNRDVAADENKAVVQQFYDEWSSGAIDFERLVHPDVINHQPERHPETGLDNFRRAVEGVMSAVPDSTWTTLRLVAEGDIVVCHNRWSGTYHGTMFRGVPTPNTARFSVEHIHIYRVADGRIREHWVVRDDLAMMQKLGAIRSL
jgi:predicted ester cyclase